MSAVDDLCRLLDTLGLGTYRDGPGGDIFLGALPADEPHVALAVAVYGGDTASALHGDDPVSWQIRIRGPVGDAHAPADRAQHVYDTLHGLGKTRFHSGARATLTVCEQGAPIYSGLDQRGCHEWTVNAATEIRRRPRRRPLGG